MRAGLAAAHDPRRGRAASSGSRRADLVALVIGSCARSRAAPRVSAYATQPRAAAYAELLRRAGHPVRPARPLAERAARRGDARRARPAGVEPEGAPRARRFVRDGGRLVAVAARWPGWRGSSRHRRWRPADGARRRTLPRSARRGPARWCAPRGRMLARLGGALPVLGAAGAACGRRAPAAAARAAGRRLAAAEPPAREADDAALGLGLAGAGRPVTFPESVHGYGAARGLAGVPAALWALRAAARRPGGLWRRPPARPAGGHRGDADAGAPRVRRGARRRARCARNPRGGSEVKELHERVAGEVGKVVVGQDEALEAARGARARRPRAARGRARRRQDAARERVARALASSSGAFSSRPTCCPRDLTGTMALRGGELVFRPGPVFANILLADEINRTPPKTQAALLEAMQEGQVTVDGETHPLPDPFLVLATQNPIEYEGTYPLPEAQLDRFLLKVRSATRTPGGARDARAGPPRPEPAGAGRRRRSPRADDVRAARAEVDATEVSDEVAGYVVALVRDTRALPSVRSAPARGRRCTCSSRPRPRPGSRAGTSSRPTTSPAWRPRCCATGSSCARGRARALDARAVRTALEAVPVPR